jgi:murein DD-endopeptidase MepM/ murein hydrolase activator NlpD
MADEARVGAAAESTGESAGWRWRRFVLQVAAAFGFGWTAWLVASQVWWPETPAGSAPAADAPAAEPTVSPARPEPSPPAPAATASDLEILRGRRLLVPVRGVDAADLADDFADERSGGRRHHAIDILAPRDTPVVAVDDGRIEKLFESEFGGLTVYQFDPTGTFCYSYAHLERYPRGLVEGGAVRRGDTVGFVGTSGNAPRNTPHLHFAIYRLGPERRWWEGEPINPYLVLAGPR